MFFCVVGDKHPEDRAISYLRYVPSSSDSLNLDRKQFKRTMPNYTIPHLLNNISYLKKTYPEYVFHSDVFNIEMSAVPHYRVAQHYKPQDKMKQLSEIKDPDILQKRTLEIAAYLADTLGISVEEFGVTGSILIDVHSTKFSDIDLTISGRENGFKLKKTLPILFAEKREPVNYVPENVLQQLFADRVKEFPLSLDEVKTLNKRQWNYGVFKGTIFSLHPIRLESEIVGHYGDQIFRPLGMVTGRAVISDISESLFNPHIYKVESFINNEGLKSDEIQEIVTYSGLYGGIFEEGDEVNVYGKLEHVEDNAKGATYQRVLVGSLEAGGHDYIKL